MEARFFSAALLAASLLSLGASYRTQNFIVTAPTPQVAQALGEAGEIYRRDLSLEWLGRELPPWHEPCPITVHVGQQLGAGGATSFMFDNGRPFGWQMTIQGSYERLLDSVLPHEITHMIFATHFGRPLPRWADEGACTTVEHTSEKAKQHHLLINFLTTGRGIAFNQMFAMQEYPADILPLYSQGYSLARFLIAQGGRHTFIEYVGDGMKWNNWTAATKKHYGYQSLSELQTTWLDWVRQGSPPLQPKSPMIAQQDQGQQSAGGIQFASATATSPGQIPVSNAVLNPTNQAGSWYARQRDLAQTPATAGTRADDAMAASPASPARRGSDRASDFQLGHSAARAGYAPADRDPVAVPAPRSARGRPHEPVATEAARVISASFVSLVLARILPEPQGDQPAVGGMACANRTLARLRSLAQRHRRRDHGHCGFSRSSIAVWDAPFTWTPSLRIPLLPA